MGPLGHEDRALLDFPVGVAADPTDTRRASTSLRLPADLVDRVHLFATTRRLPPWSAVASALAVLLYRYSGQEDVDIDLSIPDGKSILRVDLSDAPAFDEVPKRITRTSRDADAGDERPGTRVSLVLAGGPMP
jgi:hypothetical protein